MKIFISSLLVLCGIVCGTYFYENKVSEPVDVIVTEDVSDVPVVEDVPEPV